MLCMSQRIGFSVRDGRRTYAEVDGEGNGETTTQKDRSIGRTGFLGIVISIVGTLISAFGSTFQ
jgi:hypothetical protein